MFPSSHTYEMNVDNVNENELAEEEVDSRIISDRGKKILSS